MEIHGNFFMALPVVEGIGKSGAWKRGGFVITTGEEYERKIAFTFRKDELFPLVEGLEKGKPIVVRFVAESRPYERDGAEKWITELRAIAVGL